MDRKREALEEITSLKKKRKLLEVQEATLLKDADKLADVSEEKTDMNLLVKSNALRRYAKEKQVAIAKLSEEIKKSESALTDE